MRNRLLGLTAVALVALGVIIAGIRSGSTATARALLPPRAAQIPTDGVALSVASGGGEVWVLVDRRSAHSDRYSVTDIDPLTNHPRRSYRVPGPASYVFYGAGHVWVSGREARRSPDGRITVVDPVSGQVTTVRLGSGGTVSSIAFFGSTAYAAVAARHELLALTMGKQLQTRVLPVAGTPVGVVAVGGVLIPTDGRQNLQPLWLESPERAFNVDRLNSRYPVVAAAGSTGVWALAGRAVERELVGRGGQLHVVRLRPALRPYGVVTAIHHDVFVMIPNHSDDLRRANLFYYSPAGLAGGSPLPAGAHSGREISAMAPDPAGGVIYVDDAGELWRWLPAGIPLR